MTEMILSSSNEIISTLYDRQIKQIKSLTGSNGINCPELSSSDSDTASIIFINCVQYLPIVRHLRERLRLRKFNINPQFILSIGMINNASSKLAKGLTILTSAHSLNLKLVPIHYKKKDLYAINARYWGILGGIDPINAQNLMPCNITHELFIIYYNGYICRRPKYYNLFPSMRAAVGIDLISDLCGWTSHYNWKIKKLFTMKKTIIKQLFAEEDSFRMNYMNDCPPTHLMPYNTKLKFKKHITRPRTAQLPIRDPFNNLTVLEAKQLIQTQFPNITNRTLITKNYSIYTDGVYIENGKLYNSSIGINTDELINVLGQSPSKQKEVIVMATKITKGVTEELTIDHMGDTDYQTVLEEDPKGNMKVKSTTLTKSLGTYAIIGYKCCNIGNISAIVKLGIYKDSYLRGSQNTKMRTNKAYVIAIAKYINDGAKSRLDFVNEPASSIHDSQFMYYLHKPIVVNDFDKNAGECSRGIHFFLHPMQAVAYQLVGNFKPINLDDMFSICQENHHLYLNTSLVTLKRKRAPPDIEITRGIPHTTQDNVSEDDLLSNIDDILPQDNIPNDFKNIDDTEYVRIMTNKKLFNRSIYVKPAWMKGHPSDDCLYHVDLDFEFINFIRTRSFKDPTRGVDMKTGYVLSNEVDHPMGVNPYY